MVVDEEVDLVAVDDQEDQQLQVNIFDYYCSHNNYICRRKYWYFNNIYFPHPFLLLFTINFLANKQPVKTKEELDKELDQYMVNTKSNEIDVFMG